MICIFIVFFYHHNDELTEQWLSLCAGVLFSVEPLSRPPLLLRDPDNYYHDEDDDGVGRVAEVARAREQRSPKGQGLLRKEGPPTYAILS